MKTLFKLLVLLILLPVSATSHEKEPAKFIKQKNIKKAYIVNSDAGIDIQNSYGNISITTWEQDKVELDIVIKVSGNNEKWVIEKLNSIDVSIEALKNRVSAKTVIESNLKSGKGSDRSFEINYIIKIPKNGSVKINNKFGDVMASDLFASTDFKCKYGKITLGKLNSGNNLISIEYCNKSTVDFIKSGSIEANYSGLTLNNFGTISLNSDYTDINFGNGENIKYNCSYGKLHYGKIGNLEGTGNYLTIRIEEIGKKLSINTKYSKLAVDKITAKAGDIAITSGYTSVDVGYDPEYSFDFRITLKYANLKYDSAFEMKTKDESSSSKSYQGYYRKSGENKVTIDSDYGDVSLASKR